MSSTTSDHTTVFETIPFDILDMPPSLRRGMSNDIYLDPYTMTFFGVPMEPVSKIQPSVHTTVLKEKPSFTVQVPSFVKREKSNCNSFAIEDKVIDSFDPLNLDEFKKKLIYVDGNALNSMDNC